MASTIYSCVWKSFVSRVTRKGPVPLVPLNGYITLFYHNIYSAPIFTRSEVGYVLGLSDGIELGLEVTLGLTVGNRKISTGV